MTPDSLMALAAPAAAGAGGSAQAGYGASLNDVAAFEHALERARGAEAQGLSAGAVHVLPAAAVQPSGASMQALMRPLAQIDGQALQLSAQAQAAHDQGRAMTPGEMVLLTVKCHEFMFHCQLTSNVANRTSDGLQQLFRQQA